MRRYESKRALLDSGQQGLPFILEGRFYLASAHDLKIAGFAPDEVADICRRSASRAQLDRFLDALIRKLDGSLEKADEEFDRTHVEQRRQA